LLGFDVAERIKSIFERHGAHAKISSIHVNAWFGDYDKRSMAGRFLLDRLGIDVDLPSENLRTVFCGDSPNDEPMFAAFRNSVAVANIAPFVAGLSTAPAYVTAGESADGFVELARAVLRAKTENPS
jgi:hydroxymethylpyrimidine pyrophosphatase-like HAD family hydrolase